jgi:hypothetical protein
MRDAAAKENDIARIHAWAGLLRRNLVRAVQLYRFGTPNGGIEMTLLSKSLLSAALGASVLALSAMNVSAAIVCGGRACWHTQEAYEYPPTARVVVHPDNWRWGPREHFTWREHEGRGYWRGNRWVGW